MNIAIVGTGYVGLVSGACFAEAGATVTCIDVDQNKIERLKAGIIPIYEPGLDELVHKNVKAGRLIFTTSLADVINDQEIVFSAEALHLTKTAAQTSNTCCRWQRRLVRT